MVRSLFRRFGSDQKAAIGPMYAVGMLVLVGVSAIGFDYGRMMALDSELQNAADQAALAAATQLDGTDQAMINARNAANNTLATSTSPFVNETRFANDGSGRPITSLGFRFFEDYSADAMGDEVTNDADGADAKIVEVTVNTRQVFYALTPLVGAINSGPVIGRALAGLQTSTCNVPPMMFCVPNIDGAADRTFPGDDDIGKALKLHFKTNGNSNCTGNGCNKNTSDTAVWAPGNFGFLDIDYGISGRPKARTLGLNAGFLGCAGEAIESDPGFRDPQADALNSRFDLYTGSVNKNECNGAGDYCPAENTRRNWINVQTRNNVAGTDLAGLTCNSTPSNNWTPLSSLPTTPGSGDLLQAAPSQQLPVDNCLISGSCGSVFGDGVWDGDAYMATHHAGTALSTAAPNGTRYEVYNWEIENKATALPSPQKVGYYADRRGGGGPPRYNVDLYCAFPQPIIAPPGVPATDEQKDRRVLTVAAVDCTGLNGAAPVDILRWVDLFLLQPANITSSDKNFSTEIIGPATQANGDSGFQFYGRKKAVLIR